MRYFNQVLIEKDEKRIVDIIHDAGLGRTTCDNDGQAARKLSQLAAKMDGFPRSYEDRRTHEFGNRDPGFAGGFVSITLRCIDRAGHLAVDLVLEDDAGRNPRAHAALGFQTEPAALDYFIESLGRLSGIASAQPHWP